MSNTPPILLQLNDMTRAYLMTAMGEQMEEGGTTQFKDEYYLSDFDKSAIERALFDCAKFKRENSDLLIAAEFGDEQAGEIFWHYRNLMDPATVGKGWEIVDALLASARKFGNIYVFVGADWKLYLD